MKSLLALTLAFLGCAAAQPIPTPEQFFGFPIGADKKLARWDKIVEYFEKVASVSDRVKIHTLGLTTQNHPFVMLEISGAGTLKNLDHYKQLERKLYFQGGAPSDAERNEIFKDGKAVILITNNIHSTEIGASQMVIEAVYRLATEDSPTVRKILDNVVLLLVPSLNPDGQIMVVDWYNKYVGTPQEGGPMPYLYHPYAGHDNNRDMFMFSQPESKMTAQVLWHDWFPAIWLDEHQMGNTGARIFTMPATDPINPNVHPLIYRLNTIYGQAQAAALEAEGRTGIIHNATYTNFWEGAMAWSGWWHNQVGLLTEVASARIATPVKQTKADPNAPPAPAPVENAEGGGRGGGGRGGEDRGPDEALAAPRDVLLRTEYSRPWLGGTWRLRDIVDYELTATFALLETAADRRETLLREIYDVNAATLADGKKGELGFGNKEKSYAAIIPIRGQQDQNEVIELVDKLKIGGVEIGTARREFKVDGETYPEGTYVIPFTQVFARYAKDMLEKQAYPEVRRAPGAPAEAPYDVSAWSLGMQFGVKTLFAKTPLPEGLELDPVKTTPRFILTAEKSPTGWSFPYSGAESAVIVNRLLNDGAKLEITKPHGSAPPTIRAIAKQADWDRAVDGFEVTVKNTADARFAEMGIAMRKPRIGIYQSYTPSMDEGWTRFVLDHYEFSYKTLHNKDVQEGRLHDRYDAILLPDQAPLQIMNGTASKTMVEEFRGGIGDKGWLALKEFTDQGGTLISLGQSSNLLIDKLPLPVKELKRSLTREQQYAPGTIVNLQVDTTRIPWGSGCRLWMLGGFTLTRRFSNLRKGSARRRSA